MKKARKLKADKRTVGLRASLIFWALALVVLTGACTAALCTALSARVADGQLSLPRYLILIGAFLVAFCIISVLAALRISRRIASPVIEASARLEILSEGQLGEMDSLQNAAIREINVLRDAMQNVASHITVYMGDIDAALDRISKGDLTGQITDEFVGDFVKIKDSTNAIIASLNTTMREIGGISDDVYSISEQISSSSQALAQGATEQASAVEELLSTINVISDRVSENAEHAGTANQKAGVVRGQITTSNDQMKTLMEAMNKINSTSNQVATIVKIIEDIAFQTNILALNAAVEAARAGVNGKSFAVVADEVKNLATKSAAAADDTTKLIQDTISAVENGMSISTETAALLSGVVTGVDEMADIVSTISSATAEESISIKQVVQGLDQVSTVVQSNSATAEETAAVSHQLADSAKNLQNRVRTFRLKN